VEGVSARNDWGSTKILVILLLAVQVISVVFAWLLNPLAPKSETEYALLLAVDLVAFALISYVGRLGGAGKNPREGYVLAGSAVVLLFMFLVLPV
jgi:membrane associated rhomboid family serine protease